MSVVVRFKVGEIAVQVLEAEGKFLLEHYVGEHLHYSQTYAAREKAMRDFEFLKRETISGEVKGEPIDARGYKGRRGHH
ncbi:MAG: hypothetical protein HY558_06655 [Euryarchaeota archaeon]|nr:hypothetical protein [Euryarchaeota archaeon]